MTAATSLAVASPFRGLAPFGDSDLDALLFFGRERETEVAVANLIASRLTVLFGPSGVGKTSLLQAGVARRLRELARKGSVDAHPDAAVVVFSSWADEPVARLAASIAAEVAPLARGAPPPPPGSSLAEACEHWSAVLDGELYLVLDQLEEYFVYHGDEPGGGALVTELPPLVLVPSLRVHLLLSLREDSLALLEVFKERIPHVFGNQLRLDRLDRRAARAAILGPTQRWNELVEADHRVTVEPGLVDDVLAQAASGADADRIEPPYLQLVMERMWDEEHERGSRVLRQATLEDLGGAGAIVRDHLDRALAVLDDEDQDAAARMFEHLVTPSGTKIAHRAADLAQFAHLGRREAEPVLGALGRERILRPLDAADGDRYEIFHDVLAEAILDWRRRRELERERAVARRRLRRLAVVAVAALVALAVMTGVSIYALSQRREARHEAEVARASAQEARAAQLASQALQERAKHPAEALRAAFQAASSSARHEGVLRTVLRDNRLRRVIDVKAPLGDVEYVDGGPRALAATQDGAVFLIDPARGKIVRRLAPARRKTHAAIAPDGTSAVVYGPDGALLVRADGRSRSLGRGNVISVTFTPFRVVQTLKDDTIRIADGATGAPLPGLVAAEPLSAVGNARGTRVLAIRPHGLVREYDARDGSSFGDVPHLGVTAAAFSPVGGRFATAGTDGHARTWDVVTLRNERDFTSHRSGAVLDLSFSPRGTYLAAATSSGLVQVWRVEQGTRVSAVTGHTNVVDGLKFSPNGNFLATWSRDGSAIVSKVDTGLPIAALEGHDDEVTGASFDESARRLLTASLDGKVRLWNVGARPLLSQLARLPEPLVGIDLVGGKLEVRGASGKVYELDGRTGRVLATRRGGPPTARSADGAVTATARGRFVDVRNGARRVRLAAGGRVADVAVSADGRIVAAAAGDRALLWPVSGEPRRVLDAHEAPIRSVAFSRDGARVVTAGEDDAVIVWRTADGARLFTKKPQFGVLSDARFSPNRRWIVTAGPVTAAVLNARTGERQFLLDGHTDELRGATFDRDGRRIYTVALDGTVRTYLCAICGGLGELKALANARLAKLPPE